MIHNEYLVVGQSCCVEPRLGCVHLLLEAGDPDLEKLVHALAEDGEEAHAFQQRQRLILGDRQDAVVEIELR